MLKQIMAIHKFGCSAESLQNDKVENLEKELESQTNLINIKLIDISNKLETYIIEFKVQTTEGHIRLEEIQLKYGETTIMINAEVFLVINKN